MVMVLFVGDIASETCHNYLWHQGLTCSSYPAGQIVPCLDASTPPMVIPSLTHLRSAPIILSRPFPNLYFLPMLAHQGSIPNFSFSSLFFMYVLDVWIETCIWARLKATFLFCLLSQAAVPFVSFHLHRDGIWMCVQCYGSMGVLLFGQGTLDSNVHVMLRLTMCVWSFIVVWKAVGCDRSDPRCAYDAPSC